MFGKSLCRTAFHRFSRRCCRVGVPLRVRLLVGSDTGSSTVEYAIGAIAAGAFGMLLYVIVTSHPVSAALSGLIQRALTVKT